ncbi:hypothetical protein LQL77_24285 [Rhodococcus cerastii]|nr:hypothetical protein [Rhodococcus cerastii]
MNIHIDAEGDSRYVTLDEDNPDCETWQQVSYVIYRAAFETLGALKRAGIAFGDETVQGDIEGIFFYFRVGPSSAEEALGILRDATQTALHAWQELTDPSSWLPDSTETN